MLRNDFASGEKKILGTFLLCVAMALTSCSSGDGATVDPALNAAWQATLDHIKTPSTAKMVKNNSWELTNYEATTYEFEFDAQNTFGAMLRQQSLVFTYKDKKTGKMMIDQNVDISDVDTTRINAFDGYQIVSHDSDLIPKTAPK